MTGRFQKGQSGNPAGRPTKRRPNVSAFDIVFDKRLTVIQNGVERELTIDEALQLQTYQSALKGSKMAVRQVLKMIEKRELALAAQAPKTVAQRSSRLKVLYDSDSADEAMRILSIAGYDEDSKKEGWWNGRLKLETWAVQAALSRPGRRALQTKGVDEVKRFTIESDKLKWPRQRLS